MGRESPRAHRRGRGTDRISEQLAREVVRMDGRSRFGGLLGSRAVRRAVWALGCALALGCSAREEPVSAGGLAAQACAPCPSGAAPLTAEQRAPLAAQL